MNGRNGLVVVTADVAELAERAAQFVGEHAAAAIAARGRFTVALSGGTTPRALYERLAAAPWSGRIDWSRWEIFWSDERLVPLTDAASNAGMARRALLDHVPVVDERVNPAPVHLGDPERVAQAYEATLRAAFGEPDGWPRFDLVLLGLGSDGHTASLFPGSPALLERERLVVECPPGVLPPAVHRVTFTLPLINAARTVLFLIAGADKADVFRRVLARDHALPAVLVRPAGELRFLVDRAARSGPD